MKKAVLIGHNWNSILGLARALGRAGYEVGAVRTGFSNDAGFIRRIGAFPEAHSRYIRKFKLAGSLEESDILHLLKDEFAAPGEKAVLIPVDDVCARIIDENMDELRPFFAMPNIGGEQGAVSRLMDKAVQKQLAKDAGLLVADGWTIRIVQKRYEIPDQIPYPCYAKAEIPFQGRKAVMRKCETSGDLEALLAQVAEKFENCIMLVEPYLEVEREYCVVGLCNREKVCIPEIIDETVMGHGDHAGVTCYGKVLKPDHIPDLQHRLVKFLSSINFQGLFTIDILESKGRHYFCELNLRMGGSGIAVIAAGVDLAERMASILGGNENVQYDDVCRDITFASERPLLNDYSMGLLSWREYKEYQKKADYRFVYDKDDLVPYIDFQLFLCRQFLKRQRNRLRKIAGKRACA